jgi:DNA polymerase-3 subunit epsilon
MTVALFYDTETQGLPLFSHPSKDPRQPHIVQLGACLVDIESRQEISALDVIVRPVNWTIPDGVAAIHGITTERALAVGVAESMAVGLFMELWEASDLRIGHNESFDARIMRIALMRHGTRPQEEADAWKAGKAQCTQLLSTPILKLPPTEKMRAAGRFNHKSANLREAYQHFTGKPMENAHSAMADVRACMEVYFAIRGAAAKQGT